MLTPDTATTRTSATLQAHVEYQLGALIGLAAAVGGTVSYVKPHGALYNAIARDERQSKDVVAAIRAIDPSLVLLGLAGGVVLDVAERAGLATAAGFTLAPAHVALSGTCATCRTASHVPDGP